MQVLLNKHAVRAQVDVLAASQDAADEAADFRINQRFAAANADNWRTALIDRGEALLDAEFLLDGLGIFADPAAAGTRQVAGVQRFKHQHQRKALLPGQLLACDVADHRGGEGERKTHANLLFRSRSREAVCSPGRCERADQGVPSPARHTQGRGIACQRHEREIESVHMIFEVKHLGKAGTCEVLFLPAAVGLLCGQQVFDARPDRVAVCFARGQEAEQSPGGLRGRRRPWPASAGSSYVRQVSPHPPSGCWTR